MANLNKKYLANSDHISVNFSESQLKPTILLSDLNREYNFLLELNWLARKTLKKTTYCTAFEAQRRRHTLTHTQVSWLWLALHTVTKVYTAVCIHYIILKYSTLGSVIILEGRRKPPSFRKTGSSSVVK